VAKAQNVRWIDIAEAIERAKSGSFLDDFGAVDVIQHGLAQSKLRARAKKIELAGSKHEVFGSVPKADADGFTNVLPVLFANGTFSEDFFEEIMFEKAVRFQTDQTLASFSGLQVHLRDFGKLMRDTLTWEVAGVMRGRPRSEKAWMQFILTVVELERDGLLTEQQFPDSVTLKKTIADEMGMSGTDETELDVRTYGPYVDGLWTILVSGYKSPS